MLFDVSVGNGIAEQARNILNSPLVGDCATRRALELRIPGIVAAPLPYHVWKDTLALTRRVSFELVPDACLVLEDNCDLKTPYQVQHTFPSTSCTALLVFNKLLGTIFIYDPSHKRTHPHTLLPLLPRTYTCKSTLKEHVETEGL